MGISSREGEAPVRLAACSATGMMIARAPTFLVAMDSRATEPTRAGTWVASVRKRARTGRSRASTRPERAKAALTTRAMAMMITTSLRKPSKACLAGMTPSSTPASRAPMATRS